MAATIAMKMKMFHGNVSIASEIAIMIRVRNGSLALPRSSVHRGEDRDKEQHHAEEHDDGEAADQDRIDHRRLDRAADAVLLLELSRQAVQHFVQDTAELAGPDHAHVQLAEDPWVLLESVGQR